MVWPLVVAGIGCGAFALRQCGRWLKQSNFQPVTLLNKVPYKNVWSTKLSGLTRNLQGFETPMSATEACKILNVSPTASRDAVVKAHRNLMMRNHPDNGGSNFVASKVNEAKELLLGGNSRR